MRWLRGYRRLLPSLCTQVWLLDSASYALISHMPMACIYVYKNLLAFTENKWILFVKEIGEVRKAEPQNSQIARVNRLKGAKPEALCYHTLSWATKFWCSKQYSNGIKNEHGKMKESGESNADTNYYTHLIFPRASLGNDNLVNKPCWNSCTLTWTIMRL